MKFVFSTGLNELDPIKFKKPSEDELSTIIDKTTEISNERVENWLSCNMCNMYDVSSISDIPRSTPFQYLHYYHHVCLTHCNNYGLAKGEGEGCPTHCFFCQIVVSDKYNELYDYDWIMNGSITKSVVKKEE